MLRKIGIAFLSSALFLIAIAYIAGFFYFSKHYLIGTMVNGYNFSYAGIDDIEEMMDKQIKSYTLEIDTRNHGIEALTAEDVGMSYAGRNDIINILKQQNRWLWFYKQDRNYELEGTVTIDENKFYEAVNSLECVKKSSFPANACIVYDNKEYRVADAYQGNCLEFEGKDLSRFLSDYSLDKEKIRDYITELAVKYDTFGDKRRFLTYDNREIIISGGDIFITDSNEDAAIVCGVVSKCFGIRDDAAASVVFNAMDEKWPVVVY